MGHKMANDKNIIILSEKSSGSTPCQDLLAKLPSVHLVSKTRHHANETLYWTKGASILGLPQVEMVDSEVPIGREQAKVDLMTLFKDNLGHDVAAKNDKEMIMEGWRLLCKKYSPVFLEKSPHHLCQWPALELIVEFIRTVKEVEVMLVGLVRNPMDTIYSQYQRWGSPPEKVQKQWITAYQNLLKLHDIVGENLVMVRYEDMVSSLESLNPVFSFCGAAAGSADKGYLHRKSLGKWKKDIHFAFSLSSEAIELAGEFGYKKNELTHGFRPARPVAKVSSRVASSAPKGIKKFARTGFRKIKAFFGA